VVLSRVEIQHFRNLGVQELEIPPEGVALVGANAQGKSNFVEAIYYLETFRSFRRARDDQLVVFGGDLFRVAGVARDRHGGSGSLSAAFEKSGRRKKVSVDGVEPARIGDALGGLGAVVFSPLDVGVVSEGPSERRRFLDVVLSLSGSGYLWALQRFRQCLSQRNACLREERASAVVHSWDDGLVRTGAEVMAKRKEWIETREKDFSRFYAEVAGGEEAGLGYRPGVRLEGASAPEDIAVAYREALRDSAEMELRTRRTMVGPQRDDMVITVDDRGGELEIREFGSGGQRRTAALALRLVEAGTIRDARGHDPIILVDDAFAELDAARSERVLELMEREETGQVILTAPKEGEVRLRRNMLPRWTIDAGRIQT
jgi:DNA replication and repair protein RecF